MTFFILSNHMTTLFLSLTLLTTLSFDSEIESFLYGGAKEDVFFKVTNNRKTLALKPTQRERFSNLLVITKEGKYYFDLRYNEENPHQFVEVKDGVMNHALKEKVSRDEFEILEGKSSLLFINKLKSPVEINGRQVKKRAYFSKGVPLIKNGVRILN